MAGSYQGSRPRREAAADARAGRLRLLYVAPERFAFEGFVSWLAEVPVARFVVDEAIGLGPLEQLLADDLPEARAVVGHAAVLLNPGADPRHDKRLMQCPAECAGGAQRPQVLHQSGKAHRAALESAYREAGVQATVAEFIDDMAQAYGQADLVICRAGAMTVSELAAAGAASVLVPYPHAVDDHQTGNARFLSERGAALLLPQPQLDAQRLARLLQELPRERLLEMAQRAREAARPEADARVAEVCESIAKRT